MKTRLLKAMPHVALQKLRPELQKQIAQPDDERMDDRNAVADQDDENPNAVRGQNKDESFVMDNDTGEDTLATFQYGPHDQTNDGDLGVRSRTAEIFRRKINQFWNKRQRQSRSRERSEIGNRNVGHQRSFGFDENSESDNEEDFQDGIPLLRRT